MFLSPTLPLTSADLTRYDYIQSASSSDMEARFTQKIAELVAENVVRVAAQQAPLRISDLDIAGGGDGHTFVVRLLVTTAVDIGTPNTQWSDGVLEEIRGRFWMGADAEALEDYQEAAIASFLLNSEEASQIAAGMAGASKGTRFMAFIAGVVETLT